MMKTCRKLVAMVLLLLIHLLTLQIGDAGRNHTSVSNAKSDPKIILEEVIITGSGNNTHVIANAVAENASNLDDEMLSILSKRELRRSGRSNSHRDDQVAAQSRAEIVNVNDEDDLELMNRVIAKYEPKRLTSRKTKRKIVDGSNGTHAKVHDKVPGSTTEYEKAYAELLRNISQKTSELLANNQNARVAHNPYLSQAVKQLNQIYIPEVTIRPATNDGEDKSYSDIDSSFTSPTLSKKSKKLPKKYLQLNRTATTPLFSSVEETKSAEKSAGTEESSAPALKISNGKTKLRNGSLSSAPASKVYSVPTEKLKSRRDWNVEDSSIQAKPQFILRLNNSNSNNVNVNNLKSFNVPNDAAQLPPKYAIVPRPFTVLQSPSPLVTTNIDASYRKPSFTPTGFNHQQQPTRSSANVLPLVLPTDLFNPPPARRYVPIRRANRLNLEGNSATVVSTEASPPTSPVGEKTTLADYDALYTAVIGTTRSPLVTINSQPSYGSDYYAITESPTERTVTKTNFATTYIPSQTSASYTVQRQKDSPAIRKTDFLPRIASYNTPDEEKSSLNENPGIALYNKFANLYSTNVPNVFNAPKAITQDFKQPVQPSQQQVSTLPYATLKPLTPTLLKVRPITSSKPAPYYDSRLLVSQDGKYNKDNDEKDKTNEQSRVEDTDETEKEDDNDDNDDTENYKTQINRETYKLHKTPDKQREKQAREEAEEDRYPQQRHNYRYQDKAKHYKYDENDESSKNDDGHEKNESVRHENNDDEEEVDETEEEVHVSSENRKDENNDAPRHQYNKYEYDRDSDEEQREKPRYDKSKKYDNLKDRRDKHDYESEVERRIEHDNKYFKSLYNDDKTRERNKEYRDRFDKKKLVDDNRYKKDRQNRKYEESEDESVAEDKPSAQRSKDQRAYRQDKRYEEEQNNKRDDKRIYHYPISPRKDLRDEHAREEYSETSPTHSREEYHQQRVKNNHRDHPQHDSGNQDDDKGEDHVHGETKEHAHKHEDHHEKKKDHHFEEGGSSEHEKEHHGHEGEKGEKGYKVWHEHEKAEKGHHDKEHASKHYDEKDGEEKKHEEDGGYHEEHHHGEEGKKTAEFGEKGEHKKGHSTHGEHSVHKKDEFEKNTEFFDEFHEDGGVEKHGGHHHDHESKKGGHHKKGHHDGADHEEKYGKEEKHEKGGHHHEHKGHKEDEGHDHHYDHHHKHGKKEGHEHGKKWSFEKGDGGGHKHKR